MVSTLLITGASGFLGWNVCREATRAGRRTIGIVNSHRVNIPGVEVLACDLTDPDATRELLSRTEPSAVIHLAAVSQPNVCEQKPERTRVMNVETAIRLARLCAERAIPMAFTSTDLVFDGRAAPYLETDPVGPVNEYGRQKAEAEEGILAAWPRAVVCRMPLMYGDSGPVATSFIQHWCDTLERGEPLRLFIDEFRTPVSGRDAARGLLAAVDGAVGRIHLGGKERISRYEFGLRLAAVFRYDADLVIPARQAQVRMAAARPADVSLDSTRAYRSLRYAPGTIHDELAAVARIVHKPHG